MANVTGTNGNDSLRSTRDPDGDLFRGRGGDDLITGGIYDDRAEQNITRDGADYVNLRGGLDLVTISADSTTNVRLSVFSRGVGDANPYRADGRNLNDLAVRLEAEDGGVPFGARSFYDDEGIIFSAGLNVTFDVRDLVTGQAYGEGYEVVILGTEEGDTQTVGSYPGRSYFFDGGKGNDRIFGSFRNDALIGGQGNDRLDAGLGDDKLVGGLGADLIIGGAGDDTIVSFDINTDGADKINLGAGSDVMNVSSLVTKNVRLTFTSAEVGDNRSIDGRTGANQDGDLAVRMQAETNGSPAGPITRVDDEGVTFVASAEVTFDVRDLVTGVQRGEGFGVVHLGTAGRDAYTAMSTRNTYINGGLGSDTLTGNIGDDVLVGGDGADRLLGGIGADTFIGGAGSDIISGGAGDDVAVFTVLTDGTDQMNLGAGDDRVVVNAPFASNLRLTFASAEVGNGSSLDGNTLGGRDGGLAVRLQPEDAGVPFGGISRFDDEGITFFGGQGVTFDVRDLVSGAARGEAFGVVRLGTTASETISGLDARAHYINGGGGADTLIGGAGDDTLVGGLGNDTLTGREGRDTLLGGAGADLLVGGLGDDVLVGGPGGDYLAGQGGADTFRFDASFESVGAMFDTIGDFESGTDKIDISALTKGIYSLAIEAFDTYDRITLDSGVDGVIDLVLVVQGDRVDAFDFVL